MDRVNRRPVLGVGYEKALVEHCRDFQISINSGSLPVM